jgi:hypothetical protein
MGRCENGRGGLGAHGSLSYARANEQAMAGRCALRTRLRWHHPPVAPAAFRMSGWPSEKLVTYTTQGSASNISRPPGYGIAIGGDSMRRSPRAISDPGGYYGSMALRTLPSVTHTSPRCNLSGFSGDEATAIPLPFSGTTGRSIESCLLRS